MSHDLLVQVAYFTPQESNGLNKAKLGRFWDDCAIIE